MRKAPGELKDGLWSGNFSLLQGTAAVPLQRKMLAVVMPLFRLVLSSALNLFCTIRTEGTLRALRSFNDVDSGSLPYREAECRTVIPGTEFAGLGL